METKEKAKKQKTIYTVLLKMQNFCSNYATKILMQNMNKTLAYYLVANAEGTINSKKNSKKRGKIQNTN